jgi:hypothetical protein
MTTISTRGPQLSVEIDGRKVTLEMSFPGHYEAIEWYEQIVKAARGDRNLVLEFTIMGPER